jgi:hypothetical protein
MIVQGPRAYCWRCGGKGVDPRTVDGVEWMCVVCAPLPDDTYTGRHKVNPVPPSEEAP